MAVNVSKGGWRRVLNWDPLYSTRSTDGHSSEQEPADELQLIDVSPVGLALAAAGALAMLIGVFLPMAETSEFARIAKNSLIQNGSGWLFIGIALGEAAMLFRAYKARRRTRSPIIAGAIALAAAIYLGNSSEVLRLCSLSPLDYGQDCVTASAGIGIYMAGLGGLLMLVGGWQIRSSKARVDSTDLVAEPAAGAPGADRELKTCPECAENVLERARVCKHCGYRFGPPVVAD